VNDAVAALRSLFHGDHYGRPGTPWPEATPYVRIWCPHQKRCRMGGVYETQWGLLLLRRGYRRIFEREDGREFHGGGYGGSIIAAVPALTLVSGDWHCRHGQPGDGWATFDIVEVAALAEEVHAGRARRPVDYVLRRPG